MQTEGSAARPVSLDHFQNIKEVHWGQEQSVLVHVFSDSTLAKTAAIVITATVGAPEVFQSIWNDGARTLDRRFWSLIGATHITVSITGPDPEPDLEFNGQLRLEIFDTIGPVNVLSNEPDGPGGYKFVDANENPVFARNQIFVASMLVNSQEAFPSQTITKSYRRLPNNLDWEEN